MEIDLVDLSGQVVATVDAPITKPMWADKVLWKDRLFCWYFSYGVDLGNPRYLEVQIVRIPDVST